jgi:hypothetical protein
MKSDSLKTNCPLLSVSANPLTSTTRLSKHRLGTFATWFFRVIVQGVSVEIATSAVCGDLAALFLAISQSFSGFVIYSLCALPCRTFPLLIGPNLRSAKICENISSPDPLQKGRYGTPHNCLVQSKLKH